MQLATHNLPPRLEPLQAMGIAYGSAEPWAGQQFNPLLQSRDKWKS
ncbi:hypothetical protein WCLP8_3260002 [uncultured Gammaproteobacteria bacterium]